MSSIIIIHLLNVNCSAFLRNQKHQSRNSKIHFKKNDWERELSDIKTDKEDFEDKHEKLLEAQDVIDKTKKLQELSR